MRVLAGDIGGTKTILALADIDGGTVRIDDEERFASQDHPDFESLVERFLERRSREGLDAAVFAVAGPVVRGRADVTKLPWTLEETALARRLSLRRVRLVNDFLAIAYGIEALGADDLVPVKPGARDEGGPVAVLGAGTGLGETFLVRSEDGPVAVASEGGHADFAPRTELEIEFLRYMTAKYGHVSYDRVVSGPGIADIYEFLRATGRYEEPAALREAVARAEDPAPVIQRFADEESLPLAEATLDLFVGAYGAEAGNLALRVVATGGVFLAGGITPKMLHRIDSDRFREAFVAKGRLRSFVETVPVYAIRNARVGLLGAALAASRLR